MRILMLCYEFPPLGGGGARVAFGLSKELVARGHEVDLVTMGFRGLARREQIHGVRIHRVACLRRSKVVCAVHEAVSYVLGALPVVLRLVRQHRYDLTHSHFIFPDGFIAWMLRAWIGLPYVITAHGTDVPGYNPERAKIAHRLMAPLWRAVTRGAGRLVCPSGLLQSLILRQRGAVRTTVVPNGITVEHFRPDRPKHKRILAVTRMLERKGVQYVLKAIEGCALDHEVHIVGDGPYLSVLQRMAQRMRTPVKFWGWLEHDAPELKELYETSSIYVLASESENFPIVLLEAMASGAAIVTTQGTGCAEVVGETAILVPPKDPEALRDALRRLCGDPQRCRTLGQAARTRLEECFSWTAITQQYLAVYREQVNGGNGMAQALGAQREGPRQVEAARSA